MPEFSLDLNEEQRDLRDWVHGFAADVVRPAAAEWDAREETPWPVIQEAAKIGLYGFEFLANTWADPTAYDTTARKLASLFRENFRAYTTPTNDLTTAGPRAD